MVNELLNDRPRLTSLYQKSTKIVLAVVVFICTIFISSGSTFLTLWINAELAANSLQFIDHSHSDLRTRGLADNTAPTCWGF